MIKITLNNYNPTNGMTHELSITSLVNKSDTANLTITDLETLEEQSIKVNILALIEALQKVKL